MADKLIKKSKKKERNQNIQVAVRLRPMNSSEKNEGARSNVQAFEQSKTIVAGNKSFSNYDYVYGIESTQYQIYKDIVEDQIGAVLQGYNCTIFAYGQTGTGKTFTMEGEHDPNSNYSWDKDPNIGIIPRTLLQLFAELDQQESEEYSVRVSYVELYNEELYDLLGASDIQQNRLRIFDDPVHKGSVVISGMEEVRVRKCDDVYQLLRTGAERRKTATTLMNMNSSRSHSVFTVTVIIRENALNGEELLRQGKLHLVDLAGSECIGRSGAIDKRAREAANINQSLLTLGRVINCLTSNSVHIPYRESKLTRLLQDSLGGRTITTIIATISPASTNLDETVSTLEYAHRAKNIKNHPEINQKMSCRNVLKGYNDEIERLRRDLRAVREKNGVYLDKENYETMQSHLASQSEKIEELEARLESMIRRLQMALNDMSTMDEHYRKAYIQWQAAKERLERRRIEMESIKIELAQARFNLEETNYLLDKSERLVGCMHEQSVQLRDVCNSTTSDLNRLHDKFEVIAKIETNNHSELIEFSSIVKSKVTNCRDDIDKRQLTSIDIHSQIASFIVSISQLLEQEKNQSKATLMQLDENLIDFANETADLLNQKVQLIPHSGDTPKRQQRDYPVELIDRIDREMIKDDFAQLKSPLRPSLYRARESFFEKSSITSPNSLRSAMMSSSSPQTIENIILESIDNVKSVTKRAAATCLPSDDDQSMKDEN